MPDRNETAPTAAPAAMAVAPTTQPAAPVGTAPDSPAAGIPSAARGIGAVASDQDAALPMLRGEGPAEQIENLFRDMLGGSRVAADTESWNLAHAFKERVKALVAGL
jgi:hypothetical protein